MPAFEHWRIVRVLGKQRYLFASLLTLLFIFPLAATIPDLRRLMLYTILTFIIITGPLALAAKRKEFAIAVALALLTYVPGWLHLAMDDENVAGFISSAGASSFFAYLGVLVFKEHLFNARVSPESVLAAVNAYLCMGLAFAFLYVNIAVVFPEAFSGTFMDRPVTDQVEGFIYYSFVTLTTLGYGDITPNTMFAGTLAYGEALMGQLFVALTIARVVGLQVAHQD